MSVNAIDLIALPYEKCREDLAAFRNRNRPEARDAGYFDWRYLKRPSGKEPVIAWALGKDGAPAGSLSLIPHEYSVNGRAHFFGVLGDISVSAEARGQGIAGKMLEYLHGLRQVRELSALIVLPNEEASRPLKKAGWTRRSSLERHVKLLDIEGRLREKAGSFLASVAAPPVNLLLRVLKETTVKVPGAYKAVVAGAFDERFDELWALFPKEGLVTGRRDRAYLSWRFASHPVEKFSVFLLSEGARPSGYIVYRNDSGALKVYDLLCPSGGVEADYLLASFLDFARSLDASSVALRASAAALSGFDLNKFGFIKRPDEQELMTHSVGTDGPAWNNWHITAGDKDV